MTEYEKLELLHSQLDELIQEKWKIRIINKFHNLKLY